jgi:hypothetical protein
MMLLLDGRELHKKVLFDVVYVSIYAANATLNPKP